MRRLAVLAVAAGVVLYVGNHAATGPVTLPSGGDYGTTQLQNLWMQAGGSQATAVNAACHAIQESSGDPAETSPNPDGGINVGLWQLDTKGKGAGYGITQLKDPLTNAKAAVAGTRGGADWSAWATPGC